MAQDAVDQIIFHYLAANFTGCNMKLFADDTIIFIHQNSHITQTYKNLSNTSLKSSVNRQTELK